MTREKKKKFLCAMCAFEIGKSLNVEEVKTTSLRKDKCDHCGKKTFGADYLISWRSKG